MADSIPLERSITDKIMRWLRAQPECWCFKVAGSAGQQRGVPDIVCSWKGRFIALEVKRPQKGCLTPLQAKTIENINARGGAAFVVHGLEEVKQILIGGDEVD